MDHLWSPWRYNYVSNAGSSIETGTTTGTTAGTACFFCRAASRPNQGEEAAANDDAEHLVILRAEKSFAMLNRFPYSTGHLLVAPYAHVATLEDAETAALEEMMRLAQRLEKVLRATYRPQGINLGFNIGQCAGAGVAGHIHLHVLPRWFGDTSFMTTVGETRVLPEELSTTYRRMTAALRSA